MVQRIFGALLVAAIATGCGASSTEVEAVTSLTGNADHGQKVFASNCQVCHGADGTSGSAHENTPAVAKNEPEQAVGIMLTGEDEMPAFGSTLTSQDMADVLAYLKTL